MDNTSSRATSGKGMQDTQDTSHCDPYTEHTTASRASTQRPLKRPTASASQAPHRSSTIPTAGKDPRPWPTQQAQNDGAAASIAPSPANLAIPIANTALHPAPEGYSPAHSTFDVTTQSGPMSPGYNSQMLPQQEASRPSANGTKRHYSELQHQSDTTDNPQVQGFQGSIQVAKKQKANPANPPQRESGSAPPAPARKTSGGKQESEWAKTVRAQRERERAANSQRTIAPKPAKRPESLWVPAAVETSAIQRGHSSQHLPVASAPALLPSQSYNTFKAGRDFSNGADSSVARSMTGAAGLASGKGSNTGSNSRPSVTNTDLQGRFSPSSDRTSRVSYDAHKTASGDSSRLPANAKPRDLQLDRAEGRSEKKPSSTSQSSAEPRHGQVPPVGDTARTEKSGMKVSHDADRAGPVHPRMFLPVGPSRLRESWTIDEDYHDQGAIEVGQDRIQEGGQSKPVRKPGVPAEHYRAQYDDILGAQNSASDPQAKDGNAQDPDNDGLVLFWDQAIEAPPVVDSAASAWKSEEAKNADVSFTTDYTLASTLPNPPIVASINLWHPFMNTRTARQMSRAILARQGAGAEADWRKRAEEMLAHLD